jgi:Raf kinase inhibitor-like YbhB/YbcL family protein
MAIVANSILKIKSPAFADNGLIPAKYGSEGLNVNPELQIGDLPEGTVSLAVIMEDTDAPSGNFVHWIMWNIPPVNVIEEDSRQGETGKNSRKENKYYGPNPPGGVHHYHFRIYALNALLNLPSASDKEDVLKAMDECLLGSGEITGLFMK